MSVIKENAKYCMVFHEYIFLQVSEEETVCYSTVSKHL